MPQKKKSRVFTNRVARRPDLGGKFFRSNWEANVARWLNHLIECGAVVKWEYEPREFVFEKERRGICQHYTPDFFVYYKEDPNTPIILEVKGQMDKVSKSKLSRMKKYFPEWKIEIIGAKAYASIEKDACKIIAEWE